MGSPSPSSWRRSVVAAGGDPDLEPERRRLRRPGPVGAGPRVRRQERAVRRGDRAPAGVSRLRDAGPRFRCWWPVRCGRTACRVGRPRVRRCGTWVPDLVVGWTLIVAGLIAWRGRPESRVGVLLVGVGFTWFVGQLRRCPAGVVGVGRGARDRTCTVARWCTPCSRSRLAAASGRVERAAVTVGYAAALVEPVWANEWVAIGLAAMLAMVAVGARRARRRVSAGPGVRRCG